MNKLELITNWVYIIIASSTGIANACQVVQPILGVLATITTIVIGMSMLVSQRENRMLKRLEREKLQLEIDKLEEK